MYSRVLLSKPIIPDLAPASILILQIVILLSMLKLSIQSPVNSNVKPVPPDVPIVPII